MCLFRIVIFFFNFEGFATVSTSPSRGNHGWRFTARMQVPAPAQAEAQVQAQPPGPVLAQPQTPAQMARIAVSLKSNTRWREDWRSLALFEMRGLTLGNRFFDGKTCGTKVVPTFPTNWRKNPAESWGRCSLNRNVVPDYLEQKKSTPAKITFMVNFQKSENWLENRFRSTCGLRNRTRGLRCANLLNLNDS